MNKSKIAATILVIISCFLALWVIKSIMRAPVGKMDLDKRALLRSKGNPEAPMWIVEYVDFQCSSCRDASTLLDDTLKKYPSSMYVQTRFYPLKSHAHGLRSALYAECAVRQGKFWPLHDLLFEHQPEWELLQNAEEVFHEYARQAGMNSGKLDACLENPEVEKTVLEEKEAASELGVSITPTFFINGKMAVGPKKLAAELDAYFSKEKTADAG